MWGSLCILSNSPLFIEVICGVYQGSGWSGMIKVFSGVHRGSVKALDEVLGEQSSLSAHSQR